MTLTKSRSSSAYVAFIVLVIPASVLVASYAGIVRADNVTLRIDSDVRHPTIRGWSCNPHYLGGSKHQREQVIGEAVNSLGITRVRWQQPNGNRGNMTRWELENHTS